MKTLIFIFSSTLVFLSCTPDCNESNSPKSSYTIPVGKRIEFRLEECGSCGYSWQWKNSSNSHLKMISKKEVAYCGGGVGGNSLTSFVFEGTQRGNDSIVMLYRRSFDADTVPPAEKKVIYVVVN